MTQTLESLFAQKNEIGRQHLSLINSRIAELECEDEDEPRSYRSYRSRYSRPDAEPDTEQWYRENNSDLLRDY